MYVLLCSRISIHAPREGSDPPKAGGDRLPGVFLSTLPARGATSSTPLPTGRTKISIHAPREGSDSRQHKEGSTMLISIHAPREGSDDTTTGETYRVTSISIHAPREGSDRFLLL